MLRRGARRTIVGMPDIDADHAAPLHHRLPHLIPEPLTAAAFGPFGHVLEAPVQAAGDAVNAGTARRLELVPALDLARDQGRGVLALYRAAARVLPMVVDTLERHRLGDQVFVPWGGTVRFVVVVAPSLADGRPGAPVAFHTDGRQGVRLAAGTWHHPLIALEAGDFLVIERRGAAVDCDVEPAGPVLLRAPAG